MRLLSFFAAALLMAAPGLAQVEAWKGEWPNTDFAKSSVNFAEILSGGPPRDGIPAVNDPKMVKAGSVKIPGQEPVMTVELGGETRAYPIRYLMWHEIANDTVAGVPVAVTYCPLCNSGIIFDRRLDGQVLTFGVSGKLRNSDMVMFDRETESWWQQFTGEGIVGQKTGAKLTKLPGWMESLDEFKARNPDGLVMAEPDFRRRYGINPYRGYDGLSKPFLYNGEMPPHGIEPLARMIVVGNRAWPLERVRNASSISEAGITISWTDGAVSALDTGEIAKGKTVGSVRVQKDGKDIPHDVAFAFAFHAFHPSGDWMLGGS